MALIFNKMAKVMKERIESLNRELNWNLWERCAKIFLLRMEWNFLYVFEMKYLQSWCRS